MLVMQAITVLDGQSYSMKTTSLQLLGVIRVPTVWACTTYGATNRDSSCISLSMEMSILPLALPGFQWFVLFSILSAFEIGGILRPQIIAGGGDQSTIEARIRCAFDKGAWKYSSNCRIPVRLCLCVLHSVQSPCQHGLQQPLTILVAGQALRITPL